MIESNQSATPEDVNIVELTVPKIGVAILTRSNLFGVVLLIVIMVIAVYTSSLSLGLLIFFSADQYSDFICSKIKLLSQSVFFERKTPASFINFLSP